MTTKFLSANSVFQYNLRFKNMYYYDRKYYNLIVIKYYVRVYTVIYRVLKIYGTILLYYKVLSFCSIHIL